MLWVMVGLGAGVVAVCIQYALSIVIDGVLFDDMPWR